MVRLLYNLIFLVATKNAPSDICFFAVSECVLTPQKGSRVKHQSREPLVLTDPEAYMSLIMASLNQIQKNWAVLSKGKAVNRKLDVKGWNRRHNLR